MRRLLLFVFLAALPNEVIAQDNSPNRLIAEIRGIGVQGANFSAASTAVVQLQKADASQLIPILTGIDGANPLAVNWLRGAAETVAARQVKQGGRLPLADLEKFLNDVSHAPRARRLAYELILSVDPKAEKRLVAGLVDDPSLELRRDAVRLIIEQADAAKAAGDLPGAMERYSLAFKKSRSIDQVKSLTKTLQDAKQPVDVATHLGYVMDWRIIGPFENGGDKGWDAVYAPEVTVDFEATVPGKMGAVKWIEHITTDEYGTVDLTKVLDKHKGAIAYAAAEFFADDDRSVELRIGCINAHKVWVNGKLAAENHVYHAGMEIDQYIVPAKLVKGKNVLLLKVCQNEQTEPWAQSWKYQLRVCDAIGTAVLSLNRPVVKTVPAEKKE